MTFADGAAVLLTLRDATGQVATEYLESDDSPNGPELYKHYIHGNGQLLASHRDCGPAPELRLVSITATDLVLEKVDHTTATGGYTLHIEDEAGNLSTIAKPSTLANQFSVAWMEFSAAENKWIRLQSQRRRWRLSTTWTDDQGRPHPRGATRKAHSKARRAVARRASLAPRPWRRRDPSRDRGVGGN